MTKLLTIKSEVFNLDKVVDIYRTEETARKNIRNRSGKIVHRVVGRKKHMGQPTRRYGNITEDKLNDTKPKLKDSCTACNYIHNRKRCPAKDRECLNCNEIGHFKTVCKAKPNDHTQIGVVKDRTVQAERREQNIAKVNQRLHDRKNSEKRLLDQEDPLYLHPRRNEWRQRCRNGWNGQRFKGNNRHRKEHFNNTDASEHSEIGHQKSNVEYSDDSTKEAKAEVSI